MGRIVQLIIVIRVSAHFDVAEVVIFVSIRAAGVVDLVSSFGIVVIINVVFIIVVLGIVAESLVIRWSRVRGYFVFRGVVNDFEGFEG